MTIKEIKKHRQESKAKLRKILKEIKLIWRTIRERDNYIFRVLPKNMEKLEKRIKKLEKKK